MESENTKKLKDFFGREYATLRRYVSTNIRDTANRDSEDIIQDVALKLFSGADRYAPINNVAGFVYKSIRNKIIDVLNPSDNSYTSDQMILVLKKCIEQLKPAYKDIIIAVDFERYSYRDISIETGISIGTLMSRRHRAIGILYKKIELEINKNKINIS